MLPAWAMRLLVLALLLPAAAHDRRRRGARRAAAASRCARGSARILVLAIPFALAMLFARGLGLTGAVPATAPPPLPGGRPARRRRLGGDRRARSRRSSSTWLLVRPLTVGRAAGADPAQAPGGAARAAGGPARRSRSSPGSVNPYAALVLVIPANVWLLTATTETRLGAARCSSASSLLSLVPVAARRRLGRVASSASGVTEIPWLVLLWVAGGQAGPLALACCALTAGRRRRRAARRGAPAPAAGRRRRRSPCAGPRATRVRARSAAPIRRCAAEPAVGRPLRALKPRASAADACQDGHGRPSAQPATGSCSTPRISASTVTTGRYVVDPFAVADALLARAGIASRPPAAASGRPGDERQPRRCS